MCGVGGCGAGEDPTGTLTPRPAAPVRTGVYRRGVGAGMVGTAQAGIQRTPHTLQQERWLRWWVSAPQTSPQPMTWDQGSKHSPPKMQESPQNPTSGGILRVWGEPNLVWCWTSCRQTLCRQERGASLCCAPSFMHPGMAVLGVDFHTQFRSLGFCLALNSFGFLEVWCVLVFFFFGLVVCVLLLLSLL